MTALPRQDGVLIVEFQGDIVRTIPLTFHVLRIGRAPDNDLSLQHPAVSRRHVELTVTPSGLVATDLESANGTFVDQAECRALKVVIPNAIVYTAKPALGESVGAAGLWQIMLAAQALRSRELPPVLHVRSTGSLQLPRARMSIPRARRAIVLSCGLNQQAAGLRLASD